MDLHYRAQTWDRRIFENVMGGEYGAIRFAGRTVVDVGAHIGAFSLLAATRGARTVVAFEPAPDNFALLERNCRGATAVRCEQAAVWRSDVPATGVRWTPCALAANTGGGTVLDCTAVAGFPVASAGPVDVPAVPLDAVVAALGAVGVLKIDAEGSEYPILMTSRHLDRVGAIVGEFHALEWRQRSTMPACDDWNPPALIAHLRSAGFEVTHDDVTAAHGLFRAVRSDPPEA